MVQLMIFQDSHHAMKDKDQPGSVVLFEESMDEAIRIGQRSGQYYEVFDFATGRNTDWNEVNYKEEDNWYYDEEELIWKKMQAGDRFPEEIGNLSAMVFHCMQYNVDPPFSLH